MKSRKFLVRAGATILEISLGIAISSNANAQSCGADIQGAQIIDSDSYVVAFRTRPTKIEIGQHFAVEFAVCAKNAHPLPQSVTVDAQMPEHQHGMNYKPAIRKAGDRRYLAEGMMFHMPGRWELVFELKDSTQSRRLSRDLVVQ